MKKVLMLLICIFMLSACSKNIESNNSGAISETNIMEEINDIVILSYNDNKMFFYEICENNPGTKLLVLYERDLLNGETKKLGEISDFFLSTNSAIIIDNGIAFTVCSQEDNEYVNKVYYTKDESLYEAHNWNTSIPMSFLERISDEEILIFSPDLIKEGNDEFYTYTIWKLNINNNKKTEIAKFSFYTNKQEGEIVPSVDVYHNLIYVFKNSVQGEENDYSICSFDLAGNPVKEYQIDIEEFLNLEEVSSYDSVYRIECLDEELFVLQTLNNRIILFKNVDDNMVRVNIPEELSVFPEGYKIVKNYESNGSEIYFVNMFNDNIIKLDVTSKEFSETSISEMLNVSVVSSININEVGDFLVEADKQTYFIKEAAYEILMEYSLQETNKTKQEVIPITEQRYENNGSFIEFSDLPENEAETIVCHDLLGRIVNIPSMGERTWEWIKVKSVNTLSLEELVKCENYHELFKELWMKLEPDVTYDYYVKEILNQGCIVVSLKYEDEYTEEKKLRLPQFSDGEHEEYWLFVPNADMFLEVFDNTRYYGAFNFYNNEAVPDALYTKKNSGS